MKVQFKLNQDIQHTDRTSYDVLNMFGEVGGVIEILRIIFTLMAAKFAKFKIKAIFASQLVKLSEQSKEKIFNQTKVTDSQLSANNLRKSPTGEIMVIFPKNLIIHYLLYLGCGRNKRHFRKYEQIVE